MAISLLDLNDDILHSVCIALRDLNDLETLSAFSCASKAIRNVAFSELFRNVGFRWEWTAGNMHALMGEASGRIGQCSRTLVFEPFHEGRHRFTQAPHGWGIPEPPSVIRPNWRPNEKSVLVFTQLLASFTNLRKLVLQRLHFADTELLRRGFLTSGLQLPGLETLSMDDSCDCFLALCPNIASLEVEFTGKTLDTSAWPATHHVKELKVWHKNWDAAVLDNISLRVSSANFSQLECLVLAGCDMFLMADVLPQLSELRGIRKLVFESYDDTWPRGSGRVVQLRQLAQELFPRLEILRLWHSVYEFPARASG